MNSPLKVLQLGSASGLYGAERWILSLIKYFDGSNIESLVGAVVDDTSNAAPLCQEAQKLGFEALTIQSGGRYSFDSVLNLRKLLKDKQIDIVHSHGYKTDVLSMLATIGLKCKTVSTPHGWTQDPDFKLKIYEMMDRMIFPFFDAIVPLSEGLMDSLAHIPNLRNKLTLITNGVDIGEVEELEEIAPEITRLKADGYQVIGYIGRLVHGKGLDTLINALAQLSDLKWKAIFIGEGEQELELRQLVKEKGLGEQITFLGFRADRLSLLKGFDVFVLPSRSEGIPRCIMEAMAAEVPVVASNIPGCRTLIDGQKTGALFEVDDAEGLAASIMQTLNDSTINEMYKVEAKQFLLERYSAKRMAKEYEGLFGSLIRS
jgi:glycosyltransferase involved in cell wall biosynthesis